MNRKLLSVGVVIASTFCGQAIAQQAVVESEGEASEVLSCFYECKEGPLVNGVRTWREVTTLMLVNQSNDAADSTVVFLDGNQNILIVAEHVLSGEDLDEINVCRTLEVGGIVPAPQAGLIEVIVSPGSYGWVKNLLGKFFVTQNEPFAGRVDGIGKTDCRVTPPSVTTPEAILLKFPPVVPVAPILIENTADPD